jgi:vacuolar-type H+-ATPase subunit F/Vma7
MRRILVLGEPARIRPFRLAGATVVEAVDPDSIRRAWAARPDDVAVVVLTPAAARTLEREVAAEPRLVGVVLP